MPYITPTKRMSIDRGDCALETAGELNYVITRLLDLWIADHGLTYDRINTCIGVLECAKLELYRKIAAAYEDKKCAENGEVYGSSAGL